MIRLTLLNGTILQTAEPTWDRQRYNYEDIEIGEAILVIKSIGFNETAQVTTASRITPTLIITSLGRFQRKGSNAGQDSTHTIIPWSQFAAANDIKDHSPDGPSLALTRGD